MKPIGRLYPRVGATKGKETKLKESKVNRFITNYIILYFCN